MARNPSGEVIICAFKFQTAICVNTLVFLFLHYQISLTQCKIAFYYFCLLVLLRNVHIFNE